MSVKCYLLLIIALALSALSTARAATVSNFFTDGMVLQRDKPVKVWGWGSAGESITVTFKSQTRNTAVNSDGYWEVTMSPEPFGGPFTLTVTGNNTLVFSDVLVGDVWVCMGQSNMSWITLTSDAKPMIAESVNYPDVRVFKTEGDLRSTPQKDINTLDKWVFHPNRIRGFSAVGYSFGRDLHDALDIPIGLIMIAKGGTPIETFFAPQTIGYDSEVQRVYYEKPASQASGMYNKDLAASKNLSVKGVIYYQGENNALDDSFVYRRSQAALIQQLRNDWGDNLPFGLTQLAGLNINNYHLIRESQSIVGNSIKNVGMVVILDNEDKTDVHPRAKRYVGERLADWALSDIYGVQGADEKVSYLKDYTISGNAVNLTISNAGSGLVTNNGASPANFEVAGSDLNFVSASATIVNGNTIRVSSGSVSSPVAVRYAFSNGPSINLYNGGGHPVSPFRTDVTRLRGTPANADVTPPSRPSNVSLSGSTVRWAASADNQEVEAYLVYVNDFIRETTSGLSVSLGGLKSGEVVSVRARDHNFNISGISNEVTVGNSGTANQAPQANAGSDQTITDSDDNGTETVVLNGSASSDADGSITNYVWSKAGNQIASGVTPSISLSVGTHSLTLVVTDNQGTTASDQVVIIINAAPNNDNGNSSATAYRYLRLTLESGKSVSVQEVSWLVNGTSYPKTAVTAMGQTNAQGTTVLGASYLSDYKLYNKLDDCSGGHLFVGGNLPKSVVLDLGEGNAIAPDALMISKCPSSWSELSGFTAEGSADQSAWVVLGEFSGLGSGDFPGEVGTFSLTSGTSARRASGIQEKVVIGSGLEHAEVVVYPNPSTGMVQVVLPESSVVRVHNSLGQLVLEQQLVAGQSTLDLSELGHGMHLLSTEIQGQRRVNRILLE